MITPIILSGGDGTRLWPMSRKSKPKQFIHFVDNDTMFTHTVKRFKNKKLFNSPIILGNVKHESLISEEMLKNGLSKSNIVLESRAKNTCPAIAATIEYLYKNDKKDEIVVFVPSDSYINNNKNFEDYLKEGEELAKKNKVICFGVKPLYPETGYGYIELGRKIKDNSFSVKKFVEKPDFNTAIQFLKNGNFLWNSGIFMTRVSVLYKLLKKYQKNILNEVQLTIRNSTEKKNRLYLNDLYFNKCDEISIDYAIIEKLTSKDLSVISMNIVWSDLGSYKSLYDINNQKTGEQNIIDGNVVLYNTENCFIKTSKNTICCSDIDNMVIIEEEDVILIVRKDKCQNIKKLIQKCRDECMEQIL